MKNKLFIALLGLAIILGTTMCNSTSVSSSSNNQTQSGQTNNQGQNQHNNQTSGKNVISAQVTNVSGSTIDVAVNLSNVQVVSGYQFDVALNDKYSFIDGSETKSSRLSDKHIIVAKAVENGNVLRVLCYSMPGTDISGNSGALVNFKLKAKKNIANHVITLSNCVICDKQGKTFEVIVK